MDFKTLHVGISVYNMEESLEWYEKNLEFKLVKDDGFVPPLKARICFIEKDGFQIELFEYEQPKKLPEDRLIPNSDLQTVGTKHVAFAVEDMSALKERFVANGVDIAHKVGDGPEFVDVGEGNIFFHRWDCVCEMWFENNSAWTNAFINNPPAWTVPAWATRTTFPFVEPGKDFVCTSILERPDQNMLKHYDGCIF